MALNLGRETPERKTGAKSPPNYLSRRVQWKVFIMVGCLMLVFILMQEAKKPDNWRWLWAFQGPEASLTDVLAGEEVDTRLQLPSDGRENLGDVLIQGLDDFEREQALPSETPLPHDPTLGSTASGQMTPVQRARHDAWTRLLEVLDNESRTQFLRGLKAARDQTELTDDDRAAWPATVAVLDSGWHDYLDKAFLAVSQDQGRLTDQEKRNWLNVVQELKSQWADRVEPTLQAIGQGEPLAPQQRQTVADLQQALDRVFLDEIRDNTVFRPGEKDAWFRLLEQLDTQNEDQLQAASVGSVGYLQLYRQPADYRGKLVTVEGAIRLGHYRAAPRNFYGIDGYYIFWLKPSGSNSPIVVYCLNVPDQFPDVVSIENAGDKPELNEEVEFTGFFFKRWAYRAVDGTRLTPLLLAKSPRWQAPTGPDGQSATLPGTWFWILTLAGTLIFGISVACYVYWSSRRSPVQGLPLRAGKTSSHDGNSSHSNADVKQEAYLDQ